MFRRHMASQLPPVPESTCTARGTANVVLVMYFSEMKLELVVCESGRRERGGAQTGAAVVPPERTGGVSNRSGARVEVCDGVVTREFCGDKVFPAAVGAGRGRRRGGKRVAPLKVPCDVGDVGDFGTAPQGCKQFALTHMARVMHEPCVFFKSRGRVAAVAVGGNNLAASRQGTG